MEPDLEKQAVLLRIMAHPTRLRILRELVNGTKCVNNLCDFLRVSQPNCSQHLTTLKRQGLVEAHKDGALRCYRLKKTQFIKHLLELLDRESGNESDCRSGSLECAKHNIVVDPTEPRCPQPSSRCEYRMLCPVMEAVHAMERE